MTGFTIADIIGDPDRGGRRDDEAARKAKRAKIPAEGTMEDEDAAATDGEDAGELDDDRNNDVEDDEGAHIADAGRDRETADTAVATTAAAVAAAAAAVAAATGFHQLPGFTASQQQQQHQQQQQQHQLRLWNHLSRLSTVPTTGSQSMQHQQQQHQQPHQLLQPADPRLWLHSLQARFHGQAPPPFHPGVRIPAPEAFLFQSFRKPKRIRTAFSPAQLLQLEQAFEKNHYVVGQERKELAAGLNLSETQVKVWFQNRRTKYKRVRTEEDDDTQMQGSDPDSSVVTAGDKAAAAAAVEAGATSMMNDDEEAELMAFKSASCRENRRLQLEEAAHAAMRALQQQQQQPINCSLARRRSDN